MTLPGAVRPVRVGSVQLELTSQQFRTIKDLLHSVAGISLHDGKEGLVRSRLARRLRTLGIDSIGEYLEHVDADRSKSELAEMVDVLTTNKTSFFRESDHFTLLKGTILPALAARRGPIRIWSAGCSSGEEPYTTAIVCRETLGESAASARVRILATDISARVLAKARSATYDRDVVGDVPPALVDRHFTVVQQGGEQFYQVVEPARAMVRFARLNLMGEWPMRGPFDVIFCRNVMIYFDKATQQQLVQRFVSFLAPGGYLLVGHSESLTSLKHELRYVQPATYVL